MACSSPLTTLFPIANASLAANETLPATFAWQAYFADSSSRIGALFDTSATLELARQNVESCPIWDVVCQNASQIFTNQTLLAVCSLYTNISFGISDGQLDGSRFSTAVIRATNSIIPTCLISYCAMIPTCSQTQFCTSSSLHKTTGGLSSQGVGHCWSGICRNFRPYVNSDFGGVGV